MIKIGLYLILLNKCILIVNMFINVYKNKVLQRKIKNIIISKDGKNNT